VEEQVGEEAVEFDQDASGDGEPDGGENRGGGEKFFHGFLRRNDDKKVTEKAKAGFTLILANPRLPGSAITWQIQSLGESQLLSAANLSEARQSLWSRIPPADRR
jgi:hypothetical protein